MQSWLQARERPQKAAIELSQRLHRGRFRWIFDADIKGFYDNIDHDWLMKMLEHRIEDKSFLQLIKKWLKAGILEKDNGVVQPVTRWGLSRKNKPLVQMRTAKTKFRLALAAITKWIKFERLVSDTVDIMEALRAMLLGHFNYYGVSGNMDSLKSFNNLARRIVFKWLNRRSQRKSYNWHGFTELLMQFNIPRPRITGYWS